MGVVTDDEVAVGTPIHPVTKGLNTETDLIEGLHAGIAIIIDRVHSKNPIHPRRVIAVADTSTATEQDIVSIERDIMIPKHIGQGNGITLWAGAIAR